MDQIDEYVLEEYNEFTVISRDSYRRFKFWFTTIEKLFFILLASDIADNINLINDVLISIFDE